jgi:hypothetical protein
MDEVAQQQCLKRTRGPVPTTAGQRVLLIPVQDRGMVRLTVRSTPGHVAAL